MTVKTRYGSFDLDDIKPLAQALMGMGYRDDEIEPMVDAGFEYAREAMAFGIMRIGDDDRLKDNTQKEKALLMMLAALAGAISRQVETTEAMLSPQGNA